jgi:hypothetical protein
VATDERARLAGVEQHDCLPDLDAVGKPILEVVLPDGVTGEISGPLW